MDIQKIDGNKLKIFRMVNFFLIDNKNKKSRFFEKISLLANININITLGIPFLILSNIKINFINW